MPTPTPSKRSRAGATAMQVVGVRVAKALAHPLRLQVLSELNKEPMSPKRFHERHSNWSLQATAQQFAALARLDCIELIEVRQPEGRSHGWAEHIYRATRRPIFDRAALEAIGEQKRTVTAETVQTLLSQVAEALEAGTFGARSDAHFTWTACRLDECSWAASVQAIDALFWYALDLHVEAALRMRTSGEKPLTVTVAPSCFTTNDSFVPPAPSGWWLSSAEADRRGIDLSLAKALAHPTRVTIMSELSRQPTSPRGVCESWPGLNLRSVLHHFQVLEGLGRIERFERRSGRGRREGGVENIYRGTKRSQFDAATYEALPRSLRDGVDEVTVISYFEALNEAVLTDAIEDRADGHLSWSCLRFDELAWEQMIAATDAVFTYTADVQRKAEENLAAEGASGMAVIVGLSCFESPSSSRVIDPDQLASLLAGSPGERLLQLSTIIRRYGQSRGS